MNEPEQKPSPQDSLSLFAILLLDSLLRFLHLGRQSVWIDEGFSYWATRFSFLDIAKLSWEDVHPPLYYWLLKICLWVLPGTEFGIRVFSVLCSVGTLAVMIFFVRRHWGQRAACYVGLLAAFSPFDIYYAQEARMYALLAFLFVLSYTQLIGVFEGKRHSLILWVVACIGLAWTHVYGVMAVFLEAGLLLGSWIWHKSRNRPLPLGAQELSLACGGVLLGMSPVLIFFWALRSSGASVLIPDSSRLVYIVRCWCAGPMNAFPAFIISWRVRDLGVVAMLGCTILGVRQLWRRGDSSRWILYFTLALLVLPPLLIYAYAALKKQMLWVDRGFLGNAHILYLLAGVGLGNLGSRVLRGIAAAAIAMSLVTGEIYYYTRFEKCGAATAFRALPPLTPQRAVLVNPAWMGPEAWYYLRANPVFWGVQSQAPWQLVHSSPPDEWKLEEHVRKCDDPELQPVSDIYAYGDPSRIRDERKRWPECLLAKKIWVFEGSRWRPIDE